MRAMNRVGLSKCAVGERAAGQVSAIRLARPAECFRLTLAVNIQRPARTAGAEILGNIIL
ncbi:hypothetical protein TUM17561_01170 [Enterobacter cloacae]|nr:hypothetical protein TUM17561_01170 [Enterobacter cloacae]